LNHGGPSYTLEYIAELAFEHFRGFDPDCERKQVTERDVVTTKTPSSSIDKKFGWSSENPEP
jgi:hypothetical protein